jgi:hypothetical protein
MDVFQGRVVSGGGIGVLPSSTKVNNRLPGYALPGSVTYCLPSNM